ncbi:Ephrin-A2 ELF-1 EPH-related receptor tyrosine kinase ligand 6 [Takifugu flavidus]|uniref:Ephrin-A2 ELF-1 EPH-related receptor tyrosine kinase ligand 6 n=1 Tax=Takifugu flavidus TaxID=433684 RepID=A0A5C6NWI1_9TELE|nr:Ephrin-A2 ELF-1 EPH-related receptor tyrosine kinase ligand 6 [Takifugu flavidus]
MCQLGQKCVAEVVLLTILSWVSVWAEEKIIFDRHAVYWNSSNPKRNLLPILTDAQKFNAHASGRALVSASVFATSNCTLPLN